MMSRLKEARMAKTSRTKPAPQRDDSADTVADYTAKFTPELAEVCAALRTVIDATLPKARSRIWHGGPVWFIDEHPVVGYGVTSKKAVKLMFWNGQSFEEPALEATGKFKAAQIQFKVVSELDPKSLRRWLKKAGTLIWDYEGIPQERRPKSQ